jgi:hypothetical protein
MKTKSFVLFLISLLTSSQIVASEQNLQFEKFYEAFKSAPSAHSAWLLEQPTLGDGQVRSLSDKALIFSLWDQVFDNESAKDLSATIQALEKINTNLLEDILFVRAVALKNSLGLSLNEQELNRVFERNGWSEEALMTFETLSENLRSLDLFSNKISRRERRRREFLKEASRKDEWSDSQIRDLVRFSPNWRRSMRSYQSGSKLFLFCRHNREYPCLMVMKDPSGNLVKKNGKIWTQEKLALSRKGIPSHQVNGHTPQGIYTIDSVMPSTNRKLVFGKYRRLILNFIKKDRKDKTMMSLMPESTQSLGWWKSGAVARDVGRSLLRIHGTGTRNINPASAYYPLYPTVGCVASKENKYDGVTYADQRELLDVMMGSMGMTPQYSNETRLKGLLYVVDINNGVGAVELEEIEDLL